MLVDGAQVGPRRIKFERTPLGSYEASDAQGAKVTVWVSALRPGDVIVPSSTIVKELAKLGVFC